MPPSRPRSLHPRDFAVNEAWLAFRMNQSPISVKAEEFDIFVLQDAASMFLFGNAFAPHGSECPPAKAVEKLLKQAWEHKQEWPQEIILLGKPSPESTFALAGRERGIAVRAVAEARMSPYIKDVQTSFEEFGRRAG